MTRTRTAALGLACVLSMLLGACNVTPPPPASAPSPPPAPAPPPAPSSPPPPPGWEQEMLALVNAHRANVGLGSVGLCGPLNLAAQNHSQDQANRLTMSHTGSDGSTMVNRVERAGYAGWTHLSENVAYGQSNVASVMDAWMNSPGHRANILGPATALGVGQARGSNGKTYWTQNFGASGSC